MAEQKNEWVVRIPHAFGADDHFEKIFEGDDAETQAHALNEAFNKARSAGHALRVDGKIVFNDALANVMVRKVTDFDEVLQQAEDAQKARKEEAKQAREREAESLRSRADSLTQEADSKNEYAAAHATGATTDSEGAGSR